jgi:hypothetical protein
METMALELRLEGRRWFNMALGGITKRGKKWGGKKDKRSCFYTCRQMEEMMKGEKYL